MSTSVFSPAANSYHERAMHAYQVSIMCRFRGHPKLELVAMSYAFGKEMEAVNKAQLDDSIYANFLLKKSAAIIAARCQKFMEAKELYESALMLSVGLDSDSRKEMRKLRKWLKEREKSVLYEKKDSWWKKFYKYASGYCVSF